MRGVDVSARYDMIANRAVIVARLLIASCYEAANAAAPTHCCRHGYVRMLLLICAARRVTVYGARCYMALRSERRSAAVITRQIESEARRSSGKNDKRKRRYRDARR